MSRTSKGLIFSVVLLLAIVGGKYTAFVILTALAPVYALLLSSIILIVFLVLSAIIVPIGRAVVERREARIALQDEARERPAA